MGRIVFRNKGVTLIELLIALVISAILIAGLYRTFIKQQKTYSIQDQVVDMQQNVRIAMDTIVREVRMAGYNPRNITPSPGFTNAGSNSITFTLDANPEDGNFETIGFRLNVNTLEKSVSGSWQPVAENIESLSFTYLPAASPLSGIRMVKVTITARTSMSDPEYGSGGGYRTRELSSYIRVRNMGL